MATLQDLTVNNLGGSNLMQATPQVPGQVTQAVAGAATPVGSNPVGSSFDVNNIGATGALNAQTEANQNILGELGGLKDTIGQARQGYADSLNYGNLAAGFQQDPGAEFARQQGMQSIDRYAAAHGGRMSGATLKAVADYNQGLANQQFGSYMDRASGLAGQAAGLDLNALSQLGNASSGIANAYGNYGNAKSNIATGVGTQLANLYQNYGQQSSGLGMQGATGQSNAVMGQANNAAATQSQALPGYEALGTAQDQATGQTLGVLAGLLA